MKCPRCENVDLLLSERTGLEIDNCPTCRGVWLDRGELDKIIERSYASERRKGPHEEREDHRNDRHHEGDGHHEGHRRRRSWLSDIFD